MGMSTGIVRVPASTLAILDDDPDQVETILDGSDHPTFDVHKAWGGIHFLLTGTAWEGTPPHNFLLSGEEVGDDMGYGPARVHTPEDTAAVAKALEALPPETLMARFDGPAMAAASVYAMSGSDDDKEFLAAYYQGLRAFVAEAAQAGEGLLLTMY